MGIDGVHPLILKNCASTLSEPLSLLFKKSLRTSELPQQWKSANVTPLFKKGSRSDPSNYRPVSLISIPCKILEGTIRKQLYSHLESQKLLSAHQHGFVARKSCTTNLLDTHARNALITKCMCSCGVDTGREGFGR